MRTETARSPLIPERKGIVSVPELYRLYTIWAQLGQSFGNEDFRLAAEDLKSILGPLLQKNAFHSLWSREEIYKEIQTDFPFYSVPSFSNPQLGLTLLCSEGLSAALTLSGNRTSLGAIQGDEVEIRAFGPQSEPLSDSSGFGIYRMPDGRPIENWTSVAAYPEVWLEVKSRLEENRFRLDIRWVGMKEGFPCFFAFYIKAKQAVIGAQTFKPKSLQRYLGEIQPVLFEGELQIKTDLITQMEMIPLAGEGCFWDSEFLLAYQVPSNVEHLSFEIYRT